MRCQLLRHPCPRVPWALYKSPREKAPAARAWPQPNRQEHSPNFHEQDTHTARFVLTSLLLLKRAPNSQRSLLEAQSPSCPFNGAPSSWFEILGSGIPTRDSQTPSLGSRVPCLNSKSQTENTGSGRNSPPGLVVCASWCWLPH